MGVFTFGVPLLFDSLSIVFIAVIAFYFRKDIDIKTVCILLILESILINSIFILSASNYFWIISAYFVTAAVLWKVRGDKVAQIVMGFFALAVGLEIYWYLIGYEGPEVYFYFLKISTYLVIRFLLLYRPHGLNQYLDSGATILRLDWFIYQTKMVVCLFECAMIAEYLIRHTTSLTPMIMYDTYQYIQQGLAVWILWLVMREAIKIYEKNFFTA